MGLARLGSPLVALGAALALATALAFVSTTVNRPPVITAWDVAPARVGPGASTVLHATAADPDGDRLRYEYKAERGQITVNAAAPTEARYTSPQDGGETDGVTVTVTDAAGLTATATTRIILDTTAPPPAPIEALRPTAAPPPPAAPPMTAELAPPPSLPPPVTSAAEPAEPLAPAAPTAAAAASMPTRRRGPNQAPVLEKGTTIDGIGSSSVVLAANGYDPDGDPVEYEWDTKGCFDVLQQSQSSAEVKFNYCTWGVIRLTWKDPQGLSAFAEWTISK